MAEAGDLMEAVKSGDVGRVKEILESDPSAAGNRPEEGEGPILAAVYRGAREIAWLLAGQSVLNLFEAAALGDVERVEALVEAAPQSVHEHSYDGWTALHLASFFGHPRVAEALLMRGARPEELSTNGMANTPLHAALAGQSSAEVVGLLLERGAPVDVKAASGVTPLHIAASRGRGDLVEMLLSRGADPGARSDDGQTAADIAEQRGHASVAEFLRRTPDPEQA